MARSRPSGQAPAEPETEGSARRLLPLSVLALVCLAYLPSLPGGWVWDDWFVLAANPGLSSPWTLLTSDAWGPTGEARSDLYRPLFSVSFWPGQALFPGPLVERLLGLWMHLLAVCLVAGIGRALGASRAAAWFAAAIFGLHPACTEAVAWICARCDLAPGALYLLAWWLWTKGARGAAGLVLAICPFFKESFLLVPAAALLWMAGERKLAPWALAAASAGPLLYFVLRWQLGLPFPEGATSQPILPATGALAARLAALLVVPFSPDALPVLRPAPVLGGAALALGLLALGLTWGRSWLAGLGGAALTLGPGALASAHNGVVADRYLYSVLGPLAVAVATALGGRRPRRLAWALPLLLALLTADRAADWTSDRRVFSASLERDPGNPHAAFHLGYDLHTRAGDCAAAVPLYRQALAAEPRAGTNLLACLVTLGRFDEAALLGPELARRWPERVPLAVNTARAFAGLGRVAEAETWCRAALDRAPERCDLEVMLGNLLGQQGRLDEAGAAFERALARGAECRVDAERGLRVVEGRRLAAGR